MTARTNHEFVLERIHIPETIVLDKPEQSYTCGRGKENQIVCPSILVSRKHCIFFRGKDELYVTDLKSSNGLFLNGVVQTPYQMVKLSENDIIGIGCPQINVTDKSLYAYKLCISRLQSEEEIDTNDLSNTIDNPNNVTKEQVSEKDNDVVITRKRGQPNCDANVPNKIPKLDDDLSFENKIPNGKSLSPATPVPANKPSPESSRKADQEDDIEIIDIPVKNEQNNHQSSPSGSRTADLVRSTSRLSLNSRIESPKEDPPAPKNLTTNGDALIKMEDELQLTDEDENALRACIKNEEASSISPIKLRRIKHEAKTRFSEVDVVNLSDSEDDIFPCSQLFDTGFGIDVKEEVKEESKDMEGEQLNVMDDADIVISLSDSEDEENVWLERLSRSQVINDLDVTVPKLERLEDEDIDLEIIDEVSKKIEEKPSKILELPGAGLNKESSKWSASRISESTRVNLDRTNSAIKDIRRAMSHDLEELLDQTSSPCKDGAAEITSPPALEQNTSLVTDQNNTLGAFNESLQDTSGSSRKEASPTKKGPVIIEALHLPTGRRRSSVPSILAKDKRSYSRLSSKERKELEKKSRIEQHQYEKEQKHRRMTHKWAECLPASKQKRSSLSKEEKKLLAKDRKEKLKKLAEEERKAAEESVQQKKRTLVKPKAKVSLRTRGDFLVDEQRSSLNASMSSSMESSMEKKKSEPKPGNQKKREKNKASPLKKNRTTRGKDSASKEAMRKITKDLQQTLQLKDSVDSTKTQLAEDQDKNQEDERISAHEMSGRMVDFEKIQSSKMKVQKENTAPNRISGQTKKRVSFAVKLQTTKEYEIEPQNTLKKIVGKDAPIPVEKLPARAPNVAADSCPKLEEFLLRIFSWNPVWLEEQRYLNCVAPVVKQDELIPTLIRYKSFNEYYKIALPLLLLEIWCGITKEFDAIESNFRRPTVMCSIVESSITQETNPSINLTLATLMLEVLVTKEDLHRCAHPNYGDLVFFEYVSNQSGKQIFHKVFAYVNNVYQTVLTPFTHYNKDLKTYVKNPYALLTYTMLTKPLDKTLVANRVQRLRSVTYLRANMRMVQALQYLPLSPVMDLVLNPQCDLYQLPVVPESQAGPLVAKEKLNPKQLEAVLKVAEAITQKEAKLCFIQGPPGTGKTKVIVNIINQILYGGNGCKNKTSLRILVCAPSNAAIDEIVLRLLSIRSTIKENRFKMVRIGRPETMHPAARDISVTELAKRDVKRQAFSYSSNNIPMDNVEEEKTFLEARINALKCEISNSQKIDETYKKHIRMKLDDMTAKYELLKNRKPMDEMNPKVVAKLQRAAENKLLAGADIITCTLSSCYTNQMESIFGGNRQRISVCIVDEATQSCEAETLIPLMLGVNTLVLVGDPNQLPATILSQQAKKLGLDQSIFSRAQTAFEGQPNNPIIMLDTQYRMAYPIAYWPNKFFYAGKLKNAADHSANFPFHSYRVMNLNSNQNNDKFSNTSEAEFVANIIFCMLTLTKWEGFGDSCLALGVLTPYNNQRTLILSKIEEKMSSVPDKVKKRIKIEVNTVDSFQGQERDVIVMSCVRSQGIGFLSDRQRLCVALTRAKHSLILCGNFNTFMRDPMWNALLTDARSRGVFCNVNAKSQTNEIKTCIIR
ncbi:hypothetical protein KM043_003491 [Ampulex compressa]|nr:hypothetical protein KM043_003491 [Ampulex compressa]